MQKTRVVLPKFYRNFALLFLIIGLGLILLLAYYTFGQVEIIITPAYQDVNLETIITVKELPFDSPLEEEGVVAGKISVIELEKNQPYPATGSQEKVTDAVGQITIVNNYSKDQPLVKTTRLLAPNGLLLRLKDDVLVPAGGQVIAWVYPDQPDDFTELQPTRLTIPGLWAGLQDKIYAGNDSVLKKGVQKIKTVAESDLKQAEEELTNQLAQQALSEFDQQLTEDQTFYSKLVQKEIVAKNFDAAAGDIRDEFTASIKLRAIIIAFDEIKLLNFAKQKLSAILPSDQELKNFDPKDASYTVESYDLDTKSAHLKVTGLGQSVIKGESGVLDKSKFIGMSKQEIIDYLSQQPEVESVEVEFSPSWLLRAPKSEGRIEVMVR